MMRRPRSARAEFPSGIVLTSRWRDNDAYRHMNNAVYIEYVDTVVAHWLMREAGMKVPGGPVVGLAVQTGCTFHASLGFPDTVFAGLAVDRIGTTSITYGIGLFSGDAEISAADAEFTHAYVDAATNRPAHLPDQLRRAAEMFRRRPNAG